MANLKRYLLSVAGSLLLTLTSINIGVAAEGMWTLDNPPTQQLQAAYGFTPTTEWLNKVMRSSVRLAQGCSGSFVSSAGLVMTNHHCSVRCIEGLSSANKDYIRDGFLAATREAELKCPELELNRLEQITDVTATIKAATNNLTGAAFKPALNAAKAKLTSACIGKQQSTIRCDVVELYQGGAYRLYRYHRFQDVRLVWAPEQAAEAELPAIEQALFSSAPIYPEYEQLKLAWSLTKLREWLGADHPLVRKVLGKASPEQLAARWVQATQLNDVATRKALWANPQAVAQSNDPFIELVRGIDGEARAIRKRYDDDIEAVEQRAGQAIAEARFKQLGTSVAPDATFTLRLSYGEVQGWCEGEQEIAPFTQMMGAFTRHTGADPFALADSWLAAQSRINGSTRLNFVTTNDIIGGNSGSPVINRNAEIVGLIFDGNIHSLGGGFWYDARLNRAVAVHPAAILEALRVIYPAPALLREIASK